MHIKQWLKYVFDLFYLHRFFALVLLKLSTIMKKKYLEYDKNVISKHWAKQKIKNNSIHFDTMVVYRRDLIFFPLFAVFFVCVQIYYVPLNREKRRKTITSIKLYFSLIVLLSFLLCYFCHIRSHSSFNLRQATCVTPFQNYCYSKQINQKNPKTIQMRIWVHSSFHSTLGWY